MNEYPGVSPSLPYNPYFTIDLSGNEITDIGRQYLFNSCLYKNLGSFPSGYLSYSLSFIAS